MADKNEVCTGDCSTCSACKTIKEYSGKSPEACPGEDVGLAQAGVAQCHGAGCPAPEACGDHCSAEAELAGLQG